MLQEYIKEVGNNLEEIIDPCHKNGSCLYSLPSICASQELAIKSFITSALTTLHDKIITGEIERLEGMKRNYTDLRIKFVCEDQIAHLKSLLTNK